MSAAVRHFGLAGRLNDVSLPRMSPRMRAVAAYLTTIALCGCGEARESSATPGESATQGFGLSELYFGPGGEAGYAELMRRPENLALREDILKRAEEYMKPGSEFYFDDKDILSSVQRLQRGSVTASQYGGRTLSGVAETLAAAAAITGDDAPRDKGARLLDAMVTAMPVDKEPMASQEALFRGEMARGIGIAHALFADRLEPETRRRVAEEGRKYVENPLAEAEEPAWYYPYSNWTTITAGNAGILALALAEDFPAESAALGARARKLVLDYLTASYGPEGDYAEHAYLEYAMTSTAMYAWALANAGDRSVLDHPHFKAIAQWRVFNSLPGTTALDARNSSGHMAETFAIPWPLLMAREHRNPEILWLWQNSNLDASDYPLVQWNHSHSRGTSPLRAIWAPENIAPQAPADSPAYRYFSNRGLAIWRGGIGDDAFFLSIDASKAFPTTHDHADSGSFNLHADGVAWATDAGKGDRGPGTASDGNSHSIVQINGKSQAFTGGGLTSGGKVVSQEDHARFGRISIDATDAYNFSLERIQHSGKVESRPAHHDTAAGARHAIRHALVLKDAQSAPWAALILDDIRKDDAAHDFTWQMVTEEANQMAMMGGPRLALTRDARQLDVTAWTRAGGTWSAAPLPLKDVPSGTPPMAAVKFSTRAVNPEFAVVLVPRRTDEPVTDVSFEPTADGMSIHLRRGDLTTTVQWAGEGSIPVVDIGGENPGK